MIAAPSTTVIIDRQAKRPAGWLVAVYMLAITILAWFIVDALQTNNNMRLFMGIMMIVLFSTRVSSFFWPKHISLMIDDSTIAFTNSDYNFTIDRSTVRNIIKKRNRIDIFHAKNYSEPTRLYASDYSKEEWHSILIQLGLH